MIINNLLHLNIKVTISFEIYYLSKDYTKVALNSLYIIL